MERGSPARQLQFPPVPQPRRFAGGLAAAGAVVLLAVAATAIAWYFAGRASPQPQPVTVLPAPPTSQAEAAEPQLAPASATPSGGRTTTPPVKARDRALGSETKAPLAATRPRAPARSLAAAPPVAPAPSARKVESEDVLYITVPQAGEGRVFSAADEGVMPPVLVSPKLRAPIRQQEGAEDLSTIDLVISDAGNVESVKLASPVRDYREAMMLSAVKAWRFKPASIDGLPIRYQLRIQISVTSVAAGNR